MTTKEELSDRVNEILETDIDFEKLLKEDLEKLVEALSDPSKLMRIGWKNLRSETKKKILGELADRPLLDEIMKAGKEGEDKGPLGFGIIPKLLARARRSETKQEVPI